MLKKRSIATMMAAATVATSVAPVFAAKSTVVKETVKKGSDEQKALVNDLRKLLAEGTKYEAGTEATIGQSVYEIRTTSSTVGSTDADIVIGSTDPVANVLELEKQIEALAKDEKLYVYVIDKGHGLVNGKVSDLNADNDDIDEEVLAEVIVDNTLSVVGKYDVADFYDGEYLTAKGLELISIMEGNIGNEFKSIKPTVSDIRTVSNKEYSMNVEFVVDYVDASKENETFNINISGNDLKYVRDLHEYLSDTTKAGASKIAGEDRFETAVAIAKKAYDTTTGAVIVNATSMIDGLTAAPLAAQLDQPVLLTNVDALPKATLDYIKSEGITKVTIVGGEAVVSNGVKRQLEAMGVTVERIGGKDRHATSLEVAIKLESLGVNLGDKNADAGKVFVVAATGEADAMSIAPRAASKLDKDGNAKDVTPIIVEGFDGMSTTARELIKNTESVDLIGGKVSKETQEAYDKKGDFVAGEDRFETNAKIVRNYFNNVDAIYVAKDGFTENNNEMLVDALAVGSLAAEENAAIVLASKELTVKQKEAVQLVSTKESTKVVQVGNGLAHNVVKQLAKLLGYAKN